VYIFAAACSTGSRNRLQEGLLVLRKILGPHNVDLMGSTIIVRMTQKARSRRAEVEKVIVVARGGGEGGENERKREREGALFMATTRGLFTKRGLIELNSATCCARLYPHCSDRSTMYTTAACGHAS
jgi:hypothetical protein